MLGVSYVLFAVDGDFFWGLMTVIAFILMIAFILRVALMLITHGHGVWLRLLFAVVCENVVYVL